MELIVFTVAVLELVLAGQYKIGVLIQDDVWKGPYNVTDDIIIDGSVEVNFTVHISSTRNGIETTTKVCDLLGEGYSGFLTLVDVPTSSLIEWQSKSRHIPHLIFAKSTCKADKSTYTYKFFPPCDITNEAIADTILTQNCLEVVILHDHTLSSFCLQNLVARFSTIPVSSRIINIKHGIRLHLARKYSLKHFVIFASLNAVNEVLAEANRLNMLTTEYTWIIFAEGLKLPTYSNANISSGRISYLRMYYPDMIGDNGTCNNVWPQNSPHSAHQSYISDGKNVFVEALKNLETSTPSVAFETFNCRQNSSVLKYGNSLAGELNKVSITGHTGGLSWGTDTYPKTATYQICSPVINTNTYEYMGTWNNDNRLDLVNNVLFGNDFTDFGNKTLTIATKPIKPFVIFTDNNGTIEYSGFCIDILNELARHFKFNYKIVGPPDGMYGGLNSDGTWNGMVGMVMRGDVDFAIGPFTITSIRETVIDFTVPYIEDGVGILTKRPDGEPNKIFKMFKPFSLIVWCCIGVAIVVVGILLCVVGNINPNVEKTCKDEPQLVVEQKSLRQTTWLIYGSFFEQGVDPRPTTFSGRSMLGFWWVFTILMTSTYTANLAANLTVSIAEQPINSLEELVGQTEIEPLVKSGTNLHTLFMTSDSGIYKKVWEVMGGMPKVTSNDEALSYVDKGKHAFMTDVTQLDYIVRQECEKYSLADEIFNNAGLGFVLPENALFKDSFNLNMMKMQEAGMTERWKEEWWPSLGSCSSQARTSGAKPLGMDSLAGLFYVYLAVAGISIIFFAAELFYRKILSGKIQPYVLQLKRVISKKDTTITSPFVGKE
ncbi:glutamate receptor 4-like isoform X1 [Mytilus galloprovincialis]|uniref:glutamate receptor 4-like isoform X1 n=1 Tax=Mytilus galloprovincialis TaxID=29158 RepID=UPI003F7C3F40